MEIIKKLKNKSGGIDGIKTTFIKKIAGHLITSLTHIFNESIKTGIWPKHLKKSEVIPLHKAGPRDTMNNYRPISLISNFAKIYEKIIYDRIYRFLDINNIIAQN